MSILVMYNILYDGQSKVEGLSQHSPYGSTQDGVISAHKVLA